MNSTSFRFGPDSPLDAKWRTFLNTEGVRGYYARVERVGVEWDGDIEVLESASIVQSKAIHSFSRDGAWKLALTLWDCGS